MRGLFALGALALSLLAPPAFAAQTTRSAIRAGEQRALDHGDGRRTGRERTRLDGATRSGAAERVARDLANTGKTIVDAPLRPGPSAGALRQDIHLKPSLGIDAAPSRNGAEFIEESSPIHALAQQFGASAEMLSEETAKQALLTAEPYDVLATFENRQVWKVVTARETQFFRVHGEQGNSRSPWFACCELDVDGNRYLDASGRALPPWNPQTVMTTVSVPKGTTIYIGRAADMTYTPSGQGPVTTRGGALQIFSPELAAKVEAKLVDHHQYRRRPMLGPVAPARSSDGKPRAPIEVRLDSLQPPPNCFEIFEPVNTTAPGGVDRAVPSGSEQAPPPYWFDQISLWVRRGVSVSS